MHDRLPPPSLFHPRVHPELEAVTKRATSIIPSYRYVDAGQMVDAVQWALNLERRRSEPGPKLTNLEFASETHIGLLKQRYCSENQDSHFSCWDAAVSRGCS